MSAWIKKLHMYAGLLNLSILLVFGISGLLATVEPGPEARRPPVAVSEVREFALAPNLSDFDAATAAFRFLHPPVTEAPYPNDVHRDAANNVAFTLYSANGTQVVTLLEKDNRLRIESRRNSIWHFFDNMHATTLNTRATGLLIRMWTWYTEFSIWSLIFMSITGVLLWLASRPRYLWARVSFAAGSGAFLLLYALTR